MEKSDSVFLLFIWYLIRNLEKIFSRSWHLIDTKDVPQSWSLGLFSPVPVESFECIKSDLHLFLEHIQNYKFKYYFCPIFSFSTLGTLNMYVFIPCYFSFNYSLSTIYFFVWFTSFFVFVLDVAYYFHLSLFSLEYHIINLHIYL